MSKSSAKKRKRLAAKRERERNLAKLRGVSLLDSERGGSDSPPASKHRLNSPETQQSQHDGSVNRNIPLSTAAVPVARNRVDFVLPKSQGKSRAYIFDKQARSKRSETEQESQHQNERARNGIHMTRSNETIDDILFSSKQRKHAHAPASTEGTSHGEPAVESHSDTAKRRRRDSDSSSKAPDSPSGVRAMSKAADMGSPGGQISGRSVEEAVKDKHGMRPRANSTDGELMLPQGGLCDERMVLQAHRWSDELNYVHQIAPKGFVNLGNTCFLNATLQCLAYLPPFCQSLITLSETKSRQGSKAKQTQGQKVTSMLCALFQKVHGISGNALREGAIAPHAIVKALPSLGTCGSRNGYKFRSGRQEDAHEFLVHLLDAMHDGELRAAGINQHASGWRDRLPVSRLDETTFIHRIFGGYFRSQVRCGKCGYRSNTYDPFLDLSLEVSKKASNSVLDALSAFTRKETLDSANQWKCSGCKKYVCATKQLTVFRPPLSLCIQLKRFTFDGGFGSRMFSPFMGKKFGKHGGGRGGSKITKPIEFPANLNLPLSDGRSCAYALTGIVIHVGGSASSGHYTAYVKKPGRKGSDQWYNADDSFVEPVSVKTVLRQKDAYVLFYCRKEVKLEFPSPPPRGMSAEEAKEFGRARAKARADSITAREEAKKSRAEAPKTPSGPVRRVSTNVHPLASPHMEAPATLQLVAPTSPEKSTELSDISRSSFPTVTSSQLREYMMKRLSEPPRVLLKQGNQQEQTRTLKSKEPQENESTSSSSDESSSSGAMEKKARPAAAAKQKTAMSSSSDSESSSSSSSSSEESSPVTKPKNLKEAIDRNDDKAVKQSAHRAKSSSDNSSSSSDSSGEESGSDQPSPKEPPSPVSATHEGRTSLASKETRRTKVVLSSSDSRGKVRVMLGPRRKRSWQSKTVSVSSAKGAGFDLLGNRGVSKWDDDEEEHQASKERKSIVATMDKSERSRKRKMHLDRWDSVLDQGKRKKTKRSSGNQDVYQNQSPKQNIFQRIQSGVQRMNKGKAKGAFRRKGKGSL